VQGALDDVPRQLLQVEKLQPGQIRTQGLGAIQQRGISGPTGAQLQLRRGVALRSLRHEEEPLRLVVAGGDDEVEGAARPQAGEVLALHRA
jgi:hypothetical protein